jgi:hypothetical protein
VNNANLSTADVGPSVVAANDDIACLAIPSMQNDEERAGHMAVHVACYAATSGADVWGHTLSGGDRVCNMVLGTDGRVYIAMQSSGAGAKASASHMGPRPQGANGHVGAHTALVVYTQYGTRLFHLSLGTTAADVDRCGLAVFHGRLVTNSHANIQFWNIGGAWGKRMWVGGCM